MEFARRNGDWLFEIDFVSAAPDVAQDRCLFACGCKTSKGVDAKDIGWEKGDVLIVAAKSFAVVRTSRKSIWFTHRLPQFMMEGEVEPRKVQRPPSLPPI